MLDPAHNDIIAKRRTPERSIGRRASLEEAAVIDVGSNSVRLVVYRIDGRAMTPILNEKVMAGLGRDLPETGKLYAPGVEAAVQAMRRFRTLLTGHDPAHVDAVATAAVREASDGPAFVKRIERETGFKLRVIPGADEARLSALGVLAGEPEATGVVGDLGGSSLELIEVGPRGPARGETFPLGPLALMRPEGFDAARVADAADAALNAVGPLKKRGGAFYAVGGAWRALGRVHIALTQHPIKVLHHHEMSRAEALRVADLVRKQSRRSLERLEEAAAKRADSLPYAAVVLERVLEWGGFNSVILSSYGLREGLLYEHLPAAALVSHPLVAAAEAFAGREPRRRAFGAALERWLAPVFDASPPAFSARRDTVIRAAAAQLADVGAALHPDQRGEIMFDFIVRAPFAAISHPERAFLAAAIHHRYTKSPPSESPAYKRLLDEDQRRIASALGAALRLGAEVSGRSAELLENFTLSMNDETLSLRASPGFRHLVTEQTGKRLDLVATALGVEPRIRGGDGYGI